MKKIVMIGILVMLLMALTVPLASASGGNYHTVRRGETLFSIGRLYGVYPYEIARVNNLRNPNWIYAGQKLYIPTSYQDGCYQGCNDDGYDHQAGYYDDCYSGCDGYGDGYYGSNYHIVRRGETLIGIARRYGVNPWVIAKANGIYNLNRIYVGQRLHIPSGGYDGHSGGGYDGHSGGYDGYSGGYDGYSGGYDGYSGGYDGYSGGYGDSGDSYGGYY